MKRRYARSRPRGRRHAGFTLLEVLIVAAIIALLLSVLVPGLTRARNQARRAACWSNLKALGVALNVYRTEVGSYPDIGYRSGTSRWLWPSRATKINPGRAGRQDGVGDVTVALVRAKLIDPVMFYCPMSLAFDPIAPKPYTLIAQGTQQVPKWRTGEISYLYLVGLDASVARDWYPDEAGVPTLNLPYESPDRRLNRVNPRAVLIGDRDVDLKVNAGIPGSNHRKEGGSFCFTTGDVRWFPRAQLAPHHSAYTIWWWPRTGRPYTPAVGSVTR